MLVLSCEKRRSSPARPYRLNGEQLQCIALFVARLEEAFQDRPDPSLQWLHPGRVLMTIIIDGGGGCGKTTLSTDIVLPLLETLLHPKGVLRRADARFGFERADSPEACRHTCGCGSALH